MIATWIAGFAALAAVVSAIFAWHQARGAKRQASAAEVSSKAAKAAAKTARDALLLGIVNECIESHRTAGEWQKVLDSHPELSREERKEIDRRVRIRLGKT